MVHVVEGAMVTVYSSETRDGTCSRGCHGDSVLQ